MDEMNNLENTFGTAAESLDVSAGAAALDAELRESAMQALVFGAEEEPEAPVAQMVASSPGTTRFTPPPPPPPTPPRAPKAATAP